MALDVRDLAVVGNAERAEIALLERVERALPGRHVDLGSGRRWVQEAALAPQTAHRVARVGNAIRIDESDLMVGVTRHRDYVETEGGLAKQVNVRIGDRIDGAEERRERLAVDPCRALQEPCRVYDVRCSDLVHVNLKVRMERDERPRSTGVVRVDVGQKQVANVAELEAQRADPSKETLERGVRPAVDQRRLGFVDKVDPDYLGDSPVLNVD